MRYPKANWRPVSNETPGGTKAHMGLILHIEQGTEAGTDAWFHNTASQASAHFGNPKSTAQMDQWVDTEDKAWAEAAGNPYWISVENEGNSGDSLTSAQIQKLGELYAWGAKQFGWPLQITDSPTKPGLGWHGMGGQNWGGHLDCPGDPIKAQRPLILSIAKNILGIPVSSTEAHMALIAAGHKAVEVLGREGHDGYAIVADDGAVYCFGDFAFHGAANDQPRVIVGATVVGADGYVLVGQDGAIYAFNTPFHGGAN